MSDYILFIDTETSDKPQDMKIPTDEIDEWPYIIQIAWTICTKLGETVATRNFYINSACIEISDDVVGLHGITKEFLSEKGQCRSQVLQVLRDDFEKYKPLIVGHFLKFDLKMLEVGFNRVDINFNFHDLPKFCTMYYTRSIFLGLKPEMLRLNELYRVLFGKEFEGQHNALMDANATRDCFFELLNRGKITKKEKEKQQRYFNKK